MNAIICAANRDPVTKQVIKGFRHFDSHMLHKFKYYGLNPNDFTEQGFVDMYNNFVTREEALQIVKDNNQYLILERLGNSDPTELFSEGIYE